MDTVTSSALLDAAPDAPASRLASREPEPATGGERSSLTVTRAGAADIPQLVDVHCNSLPSDFLVKLGLVFLGRVFFPCLLASPRVRVYVARLAEDVIGLIVTRTGMGGVLSEMLTRRPMWFVLAGCLGVLRRPGLLREVPSILAQLRTRADEPEEEGVAELFLMGVHERARRRGAGRALVEHSAEQLRAAGIKSYRVLLHAENAVADAFYTDCGFLHHRTHQFARCTWIERELPLAP